MGVGEAAIPPRVFLPQICQILVILVKTKANSVLTWDSCLTMENIDEIDRKTDSLIIPS